MDRQHRVDIDFAVPDKAIRATAEKRGTTDKISTYIETISVLKFNSNLLKLWEAYKKPNQYAQSIQFEATCDAAIGLVKQSGLESD